MARPKKNPAIFTLCFTDNRGKHTIDFKSEKQVIALIPVIQGGKWTYCPDGGGSKFSCHLDGGGDLYYMRIKVVEPPKVEEPAPTAKVS